MLSETSQTEQWNIAYRLYLQFKYKANEETKKQNRLQFSSVPFSRSVMSDSLQPHGL